MATSPSKETIYIDAEDEITAIIEKVRASNAKIVALVLPKRAQTLQSIVNLKLLKRTSGEAKKNVVLITSDQNLIPIAGAVGLHVAKTPQSKPAIPATPVRKEDTEAVETVSGDKEDEPDLDKTAPIGVLAGEETIDLDNDSDATPAAAAGAGKSKKLFNKKLKIPDFNRFRLMLFGGGALLILLIVGSVFAFVVLPKAEITIQTDTSNVNTDLTLTARTGITELDKEAKLVPATKKELKKTENEKGTATGEKNVGEKAKGTVTLKNCTASDNKVTIPAGTAVSANSLTFFTDESVTLPQSVFSGGGSCLTSTETVDVTAQNAGDAYNLSSRQYAVSGFSSVRANGSDMKGGTNKVIKVVSQGDIDAARTRLLERLNTAANAEIKEQFIAENMQPLEDTYGASEPIVASTPNVNDEAAEVIVTVTITYTELGVKKDDLKTLVEENVKSKIDTSKQSIQDNGLDDAVIRVLDKKSVDEATFSVSTLSVAGPQLDAEAIKKEVAGKNKSDTIKAIQDRPGIRDVEINYDPFWVFSTPKRTNRINITFEQADGN